MGAATTYSQRTRTFAFSLIFILPLLAGYELWLIWAQPKVVNAAGAVARLPMDYLALFMQRYGESVVLNGTLLFNLFLIVLCVVALIRFFKDGVPQPSHFFFSLVESVVYGFLLVQAGILAQHYASKLDAKPLALSDMPKEKWDLLMLSVGAGVYEEILFRLVLVGGLYFVGKLVFEGQKLHLAIALLVGTTLAVAILRQMSSEEVTTWSQFAVGTLASAPIYAGFGLFLISFHCAVIWLLMRLRLPVAWAAGVASVVLGSLLFSAFHHVGPMGDPWVAHVFVFRFLAGLLLSIIYQLRGLGVAVYAHAVYDVLAVMAG